MRYFIFLTSCVLFFSLSSCGLKERGQANARERARLDSLKNDSVKKAKVLVDSLALVAWGDTKFGMSKQEVIASKAFNGEKETVSEKGEDTYVMDYDKEVELQRLYNLNKKPVVRAYFKENELYCVTLESVHYYASDVMDLANDCGIITKEFMKKCGEK